jgi:hypothetical protein
MLVNYMEQRPFKVDTRLATQILRCSTKKKCTTKFVSANTNIKTQKKKIQKTRTSEIGIRHLTLVDMFRSPDRSVCIRYTNPIGISLFYSTAAMPCLSLTFIFPLEQNSTSTIWLTYFSYVQNSR